MPRDSNGTYSLPAGNPVVTLEVISSSWANTTLTDIGTAMTGSLSRSGEGSMLAGLELFAGTVGAPGLTWALELTSGLYRNAAGDFRFSITGTDALIITSAGLTYSGPTAKFIWNETDAAANNRRWDTVCLAETLSFRVVNDADSSATTWLAVDRTLNVVDALTFSSTLASFTNRVALLGTDPEFDITETDGAADNKTWAILAQAERLDWYLVNDARSAFTSFFRVDRTGTTVDTINFPNGTLQYAGLEVGFRQLNDRTFSASDNTVAGDAGKMVSYTGTGGHTFTADTDMVVSAILTVRNAGTGTLTLAGSASLQWYNGSGAISFGNRTLAIGGIATMYQGSAGNYLVWGTGLT